MSGRRRHGLRVVLAAGFCLLFQQFALAAYDCPGSRPMQADAAEAPLCASHCAPDAPAQVDVAKSATVGMAHALFTEYSFVVALMGPPAPRVEPPHATADPPPRLRYCSLLI
ncbi:MAG: hypothetical protein AB7P31_05430 [Steroidobacteraceae bacterium]